MTKVNWAKVAAVGVPVATGAGALMGNLLSDDQSGALIAWLDSAKGALIALTALAGAMVGGMVAARRK